MFACNEYRHFFKETLTMNNTICFAKLTERFFYAFTLKNVL